jgi:hypothetical protein
VLSHIAEQFLENSDRVALPWARPPSAPAGFSADRVFFGQGENALEVALGYMTRPGKLRAGELRALLERRQANRPAPVLLVALYCHADGPPRAAIVGSMLDGTPTDISASEADRSCSAILAEPDRHAAVRTAQRLLANNDARIAAGIINSGLFASHELRHGVPARADWEAACQSALPLLGARGRPLILRLGYDIRPEGSAGALLTHDGRAHAAAVMLDETEVFDRPCPRFGAISPVAYGLALADQQRLPWLVAVGGTQLRLYPAHLNAGVGRSGQAEAYTELDPTVLDAENAGYLVLLFGPQALATGSGTATQILRASKDFAADLGKRLRHRVYSDVVPGLALAVAKRRNPRTPAELTEAYRLTLLIMFRVLFLAYAEDRGLLPYGTNTAYQRHAVKALAREFAASPARTFDENAANYWNDMQGVWSAVDKGNTGWGVPPYNGGLFANHSARHSGGAALSELALTDAEFVPCLRALLVDAGEDGTDGPVDFRSIGVREFSVIYEGLIDCDLAISEVNLRRQADGSHVPAGDGQADIPAGDVYLRGKSGKRKATGTYFTEPFIVKHLLDTALEPAITAHLARVGSLLSQGDDIGAADALFDFRVADPAMGSGHFLIAAIDRIEAKFTAFLTEHPIASVISQLDLLMDTARTRLGQLVPVPEIDPGMLLRRQIARRCIYGIDLNPTAVELAKLAVWIHTCVPGLPLPTLNLEGGNSLTGLASTEEVTDTLDPRPRPGQASLFGAEIEAALLAAKIRLARAARAVEASLLEAQNAAEAIASAAQDAAPARALFDAAVGVRLGVIPLPAGLQQALDAANCKVLRDRIDELQAVHMPCLFPGVFVRDNPGFDVLISNPPWEKAKVEEHQWWAMRFPGLRSMPTKERDIAIARHKKERPDLLREYEHEGEQSQALKHALGKGNFPGLRAATDTDLSLAFAWRFWHILRLGGHAGVVLPRGVLSGRAGREWRSTILQQGTFDDVTSLVNSRHWIFGDLHPQYTIGLISIIKSTEEAAQVIMRGPFSSRAEYERGMTDTPQQIAAEEFAHWADGAPFPLLPRPDSIHVFLKLRFHPRLDAPDGDWQFVPLRELHTTDNKSIFDFDLAHPTGDLPVLTGGSFNLWRPDFGEPYAYAQASEVIPWLQERRQRQIRLTASAFYGMPAQWAADPRTLPCQRPRIAFRDVCRATDSRTMICALLPGGAVLVEKAPYLLHRRGKRADESYLLGILSSLPFDWYTRRYVELKMSYGFLNAFPVPRPDQNDPRRQRIIQVAGRLAAVDGRYETWAAEVGVPVGSVTGEGAKNDLIAELDALAAHLYGLGRPDLEHIFETFRRGWDYRHRLAAVLDHYDRWADVGQAARAS